MPAGESGQTEGKKLNDNSVRGSVTYELHNADNRCILRLPSVC